MRAGRFCKGLVAVCLEGGRVACALGVYLGQADPALQKKAFKVLSSVVDTLQTDPTHFPSLLHALQAH